MANGRAVVADPGSRPLDNPRHERFAQTMARGGGHITAGGAWAESAPPGAPVENTNALKVSAHRAKNYPQVAARIAWLESEARRELDAHEVTVDSLESLMARVTDVLMTLLDRASEQGATNYERQKISTVLSRHVGRASAQIDRIRRADAQAPLAPIPGPTIPAPPVCQCDDHA